MTWFADPANVWAALVAFAAGQLAASALYTVLVRLMLTAHERWEQAAHAQLLETVRPELAGRAMIALVLLAVAGIAVASFALGFLAGGRQMARAIRSLDTDGAIDRAVRRASERLGIR